MAEDTIDPLAAFAVGAGEEAAPLTSAHPFLTDDEIDAAKEAARKLVMDDRRKSALKAITTAETERLRAEEGLTTGDPVRDEIVNLTVLLAEHADRVIINGKAYFHGFTYKMPRHVADSMRDIIAQTHKHQDQVDGQSLTQHYQKARATELSPVGIRGGMPQVAA